MAGGRVGIGIPPVREVPSLPYLALLRQVANVELRIPGGNYRVPDVWVVPIEAVRRRQREHPTRLEIYEEPMPLVVEVWSPSTGDYDVEQKLREYQQRSDFEIWRIHPLEHTLIAWVRQPDGSYVETLHTGGSVWPAYLPGVVIELERLFD
jgi:Uma2 family endonuclease